MKEKPSINTNGSGQDQLLEDPASIFDIAAEPLPIRPRQDIVSTARKSPAWAYYISLKGEWPAWWHEFSTSLYPSGRRRYRTVGTFIRTKAKSDKAKEQVLREIIGPEPDPDIPKRVPWFGDWGKIRDQGYNNFTDPTTLAHLRSAYKSGKKQLEAARALGPLVLRHISRWEVLTEHITAAFAGQPLNPHEAPDSPANKNRLKFYIEMQKDVLKTQTDLWQEWLRCNGINPSDPSHWSQTVDSMGRMFAAGEQPTLGEGEPVVLDGHTMKQVNLPEGVSIDDLLLAKMLRDKSKRFNMQLPGDLNALVDDSTEADVTKAKKKAN